jgi:uncharacterized protein (DUF1697 family)
MPFQIGLLRAINVGGRNRVAMAALRDMLAELGFRDVQTLLQSGNVVFRGGRSTGAALEKLLEAETKQRLAVEVDYVVRTEKDLQTVIAQNPFKNEARLDPGHLVVMFLKSAAQAKQVAALEGAIRGRETLRAAGKHLYIVYPDGIGVSKLTGALIEKHLATRGTARNWNTVLKLAALCQA